MPASASSGSSAGLTSFDKRALLTQDDDLGAHGPAGLLNGQVALFVDVDDGDGGVHAPPTRYRSDDCSRDN